MNAKYLLKVTLSDDTISSEKNDFIVFQKVLLPVTFSYLSYCNSIFSSLSDTQ